MSHRNPEKGRYVSPPTPPHTVSPLDDLARGPGPIAIVAWSLAIVILIVAVTLLVRR